LLTAGGQVDEAEACFSRGLEARPGDPHALNALGQALEQVGRWSEALACYERAISRDPRCALAQRNAALARLKLGDFAAGWAQYEWRWDCPDGPRKRDYLSQPCWDGGPLEGKTVLVHGEQGVGDEIMFATCYPELIARAGQVLLVCDHRLAPLFSRSFQQ